MYLSQEKKREFFKEFGGNETNTGSSEAQVAMFTFRIAHLTNHLKSNKKDFVTQKSLIALVGKRRNHLDYLKKKDINRYRAIVKKLELRR